MSLVGIGEVARVLNVTERRVQQLAAAEVIPREAKGKYDALECAARYIRFIQDRGAGSDVSVQRARLLEAQAEKVERENHVSAGALVPIGEYVRRSAVMITIVRQHMLQLPGRVAPQLEAEPRAVIKAKLTAAVYAALTALSLGPDREPGCCDVCGQALSASNVFGSPPPVPPPPPPASDPA